MGSLIYENLRPGEIRGVAVSGKSFAQGCGLRATGNMAGTYREVDACSDGGIVDYIATEEITDSTSGVILLPETANCVLVSSSVAMDAELKVADATGRFDTAGLTDIRGTMPLSNQT